MKVPKKRRREAKTDYKKRIKLLKSGLPRVVFRRTNKYLIAQYITSEEAQDKVVFGMDSRVLLKLGWPEKAKFSLKTIPAAYLMGVLMGKEIIKRKLKEPIIDFGMLRVLHKSRVYAFLKGLKDAGIGIKCKEDLFPEEKRLKGEHLKNKINIEEIKSKIIKG